MKSTVTNQAPSGELTVLFKVVRILCVIAILAQAVFYFGFGGYGLKWLGAWQVIEYFEMTVFAIVLLSMVELLVTSNIRGHEREFVPPVVWNLSVLTCCVMFVALGINGTAAFDSNTRTA